MLKNLTNEKIIIKPLNKLGEVFLVYDEWKGLEEISSSDAFYGSRKISSEVVFQIITGN